MIKKMARKKFEPFPQFMEIEGRTYSLAASFSQKNRADSVAKRYQKKGNYARVIERQRKRRTYHCVYVSPGRKADERREKEQERLQRKLDRERTRREIKLERARTEREIQRIRTDPHD